MARYFIGLFFLLAIFHSVSSMTQGAGNLVGKRDTSREMLTNQLLDEKLTSFLVKKRVSYFMKLNFFSENCSYLRDTERNKNALSKKVIHDFIS